MYQVRVGLLAYTRLWFGTSLGPVAAAQVRLQYAPGSPQVEFACGEIRAALKTGARLRYLKVSTRSRRMRRKLGFDTLSCWSAVVLQDLPRTPPIAATPLSGFSTSAICP